MTKKKPIGEQKKKGRKSLYNPEFHPKKAGELALMGKTDVEIAKALDVSEATLNKWKTLYPEFTESLKANKDIVDSGVVKSLLQRACGYEYTEISVKDDPEKGIITTTTTKKVAPDVTAQIFWLKNRQSKDWRDKHEVENTGNLTLHFDKEDKDL
jgi:hypothetical protein